MMNHTESGRPRNEDQSSILVIDDDLFIRESLVEYFKDKGFIVHSAENGRRGLDTFLAHRIDIVLTDLRMPEMDGIEVMQAIQEHRPDVPMIVVSGAGEKEDIIKALRMGAKDYITKPVSDFEIIDHTIEKVLEIRRLNRENKRYRQQIEKSEKKYRTITENIAEGVFTTDAAGRFTYVNEAFCRITGYTGNELLGQTINNITAAASLPDLDSLISRLKIESTTICELQMTGRDASHLHAELACSSFLDEKKSFQGVIAVARDITQIVSLREKYKAFLSPEDGSLNDVLSICANCKNIRVKKGKWVPVENYFDTAKFSHGICPVCCEKLYPGFDFSKKE